MPSERNPYRLGKSIGRGGYAEVFEARRRDSPEQVVAFKRARADRLLAAERLRREIDVHLALDHPNVMPILEAAEDRTWFVMPLADGSLKSLYEQGELGGDVMSVALNVIAQVGSGLEYAHGQGYLHRDIAPGNILGFTDGGGGSRWVVGDWGTVRRPLGETTTPLTDPGEGLGTAGFAAPETYDVDAHEVDERADVYSLARVVAWLLTGRWPRPNVPLRPDGPLRGFVNECTDLDADRRPESIAAMRDRLAELTSQPAASPRGRVQELLEAVPTNPAAVTEAIRFALQHSDDGELWVDELARSPLDAVRAFVRADPEAGAAAALTMLRHCSYGSWGNRNFDYANTPLRWVHEVLRTLTEHGDLGLAEDVAVESFRQEADWDRWGQNRITVGWLRTLDEPEGRVMAQALRRSGATSHYASALAAGRVVSRSLAAEVGR